MTITINRRTARNVCYTVELEGRRPYKSVMLHAKFAAWIASCPSAVVIDNAKGE